jgi:hypothetical protein
MSEQIIIPEEEPTQRPIDANIYNAPELSTNPETQLTNYSFVEHVPKSFENNPDTFKLKHLLEMDAENTIVIVGDELLYFGGKLGYDNLPHLEVPVPDYFNRDQRVSGPVKAIKEDGRTIAFATNQEKAMIYIGQHSRDSGFVS